MSVYFAKMGRYIKIGYSENPERRVARLWKGDTRYGRPWDLSTTEKPELLLTIPGTLGTERACHKALDDFCSSSEWFIDEPGVRTFMESTGRGEFPHVPRPEGPFGAVPHEQMIPEWQSDLDRMRERAHAKSRVSRRSA